MIFDNHTCLSFVDNPICLPLISHRAVWSICLHHRSLKERFLSQWFPADIDLAYTEIFCHCFIPFDPRRFFFSFFARSAATHHIKTFRRTSSKVLKSYSIKSTFFSSSIFFYGDALISPSL